MDDWKNAFYEAIRLYMDSRDNRYDGVDWNNVFVIGVTQNDPGSWYCDTCGPDPVTVDILWEAPDGKKGTYQWYGDLGELISGL